ncbi:MAG: drug/metabolite-transporting permease [Chitinophagaceae bacterium]|nr:MAG: drug/metabolite-transporting permease [Chitinophagaceae bacterium]
MQHIHPSQRKKGYLALTVTCLVWGTTWVASKVGVQEVPALQMASIRQLLGGLGFVLFFMLYKKLPLPTAKQFRWIVVMAILMFVFANGLSTWSLKYIPTGLSALIGALYPLSVVIIERIFYKGMKMTVLTFLGLFLGLSGVAIVFYENAFHNLSNDFFIGVGLSVFAMLSWSVGTIFLARNKANMNPYYGTGWQMLVSSLLLWIMAETTQATVQLSTISLKGWLAITYLVGLGSIIAFIAFIYSMKVLPAAIASLYAYINPLVAMLVGAVLLSEHLTLNILWGSIVTLIGVYLVNLSNKRRQKIIAEPEL